MALILAVAAWAPACSDGGGPGADPFEPTDCTLLWYRARPAGLFDVYKVEMPAAEWTVGTHTYDGVERLGVFYYGLIDDDGDGVFEAYQNAASATSGDLTLTSAEGTGDGDTVVFDDSVSQAYLAVGGVMLATGGTGNFDGVWSPHSLDDGEGDPIYAESSTIAIAYSGSNVQLGSVEYGAYGYCWSDALAIRSSLPTLWRRDRKPQ